MESITAVNTLLFVGAAFVIAGILSSLLAFRFGGPLLLIFLAIGMLAGEDGPGGLPFDDYRLRVPTAAVPWEPNGPDDTLYGGVNSFGFGGTNAHAVLSTAPAADHRSENTRDRHVVWTVSARSAAALEEAVQSDAEFLDDLEPERLPDLAATARQRRTHQRTEASRRTSVVARWCRRQQQVPTCAW